MSVFMSHVNRCCVRLYRHYINYNDSRVNNHERDTNRPNFMYINNTFIL